MKRLNIENSVLSLLMNMAAMLAVFKISIGTEPVKGSVPRLLRRKKGVDFWYRIGTVEKYKTAHKCV